MQMVCDHTVDWQRYFNTYFVCGLDSKKQFLHTYPQRLLSHLIWWCFSSEEESFFFQNHPRVIFSGYRSSNYNSAQSTDRNVTLQPWQEFNPSPVSPVTPPRGVATKCDATNSTKFLSTRWESTCHRNIHGRMSTWTNKLFLTLWDLLHST